MALKTRFADMQILGALAVKKLYDQRRAKSAFSTLQLTRCTFHHEGEKLLRTLTVIHSSHAFPTSGSTHR